MPSGTQVPSSIDRLADLVARERVVGADHVGQRHGLDLGQVARPRRPGAPATRRTASTPSQPGRDGAAPAPAGAPPSSAGRAARARRPAYAAGLGAQATGAGAGHSAGGSSSRRTTAAARAGRGTSHPIRPVVGSPTPRAEAVREAAGPAAGQSSAEAQPVEEVRRSATRPHGGEVVAEGDSANGVQGVEVRRRRGARSTAL